MFMRFYCRLCVGDMYEKTETLFLGSGWSPCHIVMKTFMKVVSSNPRHSHFDVNQSWGEQCVDVGLTRSKWDSKDQAYWHCIDNHTFWCLKIKNKLEPCSFVYILLISKPEVGLNLDLGPCYFIWGCKTSCGDQNANQIWIQFTDSKMSLPDCLKEGSIQTRLR